MISKAVFAKVRWEGTMHHNNNKYPFKGDIYVYREGNMVYQITYMDFSKHGDASRPTAEKAIEAGTFGQTK